MKSETIGITVLTIVLIGFFVVASLENGMLQINLERIVPESKKRRTIDIN